MTRIVVAAALMLTGLAIVLGAVVLARPSYTEVEVGGSAMAPTLEDGDLVAVESGVTPRRGDLVVIDGAALPGQEPGPRVLRVMGVGGDRLEYRDGRLTVDGEPVVEASANGTPPNDFTVTVPADTVFLAGDARDDAVDSRMFVEHDGHGAVPLTAVEGRVVGVNGTLLDSSARPWLLWVAGGAVVTLCGLGWLIVGLHRRTAIPSTPAG
ncbi:signal peptidase I [Actinophytocola glycyrrhizae]|uniref:Signal peptidase I n=1 Tax=Actinophytocola glycyrrhizae TaxID=2044873 RepID=A0ABV9S643_9PSEU